MRSTRLGCSSVSLAGVALVMTAALQSPAAMAADDGWQVSIGAGVGSRPKYAGSDSNETKAFPLFNASYGRFFIGGVPGAGPGLGLGMYFYRDKHWRLGAALSGDLGKPRKESDDERLRGLGDIDGTAHGALFASYSVDWFTVRGNVLTDIGGKDQGTRAALDLEARFMPAEGLVLTAGPGLTWANSAYTRTFFGVDAEQSARSGLPVFDAKSGIHSARFSVGANYALTQNWGVGARVTASKLRNDAADSPITADKSQTSFGLFTSYRF
jgi:MipA family protein